MVSYLPGGQKLCHVTTECSQIADNIISLVQRLNLGARGKPLQSLRQALACILNRTRIDRAKERLEMCRNDLVLRIIVSLKLEHKLSEARQDDRFRTLDNRTRQIADRLLDDRSFFTTGISESASAIMNKLDEQDAASQRLQEETLATIATLQTCLSNRDKENKAIFESLPTQFERSSVEDLERIQEKILHCLWFQDIHSRAQNLELPFGETFSWIFQHDQQDDQRWDDLSVWLQSDNGCYWINGKAGSGKSTLMKYVSNHPRTVECLTAWSGDEPLLTSNFFFWYSGSTLQKSQGGLLRSILYDALIQYPELIPIVFPSRCRAITRGGAENTEPSLSELREAISLLATQRAKILKICLFVDGVDEYQGDVADLASFLQGLGSERTKLVCASRPTSSCSFTFGHCPGLQLQNLTRHDIQSFAFENLLANNQMKELARQNNNTKMHLLVQEIVNKASGVFLWVALVTKSLMSGLRNFDTVDILRQRLDELPSDLEELYVHMLERMEPRYRQQASCLLRIVYQNSKSANPLPMLTLRLAFANENSPDAAVDADMGVLAPLDMASRVKGIINRIQNSCCGLLEVRSLIKSPNSLQKQGNTLSKQNLGSNEQYTGLDELSLNLEKLHTVIMVQNMEIYQTVSSEIPERLHEYFPYLKSPSLGAFTMPSERYPPDRFPSVGLPTEFVDGTQMLKSTDQKQTDGRIELSEVELLHKSVIDFLQSADVWRRLISASPVGFNPCVSLASSCLQFIKTLPTEKDVLADDSMVWRYLVQALEDCFEAEASTGCSQHEIVDELDVTMDYHWRACEGWRPRYSYAEASHWSHFVPNEAAENGWPHGIIPYESIFTLACRFGLQCYVRGVFDEDANLASLKSLQGKSTHMTREKPDLALNRIIWDISVDQTSNKLWRSQVDILKLGLERGANPNRPFFKGLSAWAAALWFCKPTTIKSAEVWAEILDALIQHGADPNAEILDILALQDVTTDTHDWNSPLWVIRDKFCPTSSSKIENRRIQKISDRLQAKILELGGEYFSRKLDCSEMIRRGIY